MLHKLTASLVFTIAMQYMKDSLTPFDKKNHFIEQVKHLTRLKTFTYTD